MCPDKQTLSAYLDGELGSRWSEFVENHLTGCLKCREVVEGFERVHQRLLELGLPEQYVSKIRVWSRLELYRQNRRLQSLPLWKRRLDLPLPLVAGVFALVAVLGFSLFLSLTGESVGTMKITKAPSGITEVQVAAPIQDLERLLSSLEKQDSSREIFIQLPSDSEFFIFSEPVLLRAAEYGGSLGP